MESSSPTLNVQDLTLMVMIIDICTKRGAFEGKEIADIGMLRNRLVAFTDAYTKNNPPPPESTPTTT